MSDRDGADGGTAATLAAERDALRDTLRARVTSAIEAHERDLHAIRVALGHEHESSVEGICAEIARLRRVERLLAARSSRSGTWSRSRIWACR